jgi:hypothetical protein
MSADASEPKGRRRKAAKPSSPQGAKVKLTLRVDADTAERFRLHALMTRREQCDLFAELVRAHCKRFVVHDRERPAGEQQGGNVGAA